MMKAKPSPLIERVRERVLSRPQVAKTWLTRLPEETQRELLEIRAAFVSGEIVSTARSLARDIVAECQERGINICTVDTLREWLARNR